MRSFCFAQLHRDLASISLATLARGLAKHAPTLNNSVCAPPLDHLNRARVTEIEISSVLCFDLRPDCHDDSIVENVQWELCLHVIATVHRFVVAEVASRADGTREHVLIEIDVYICPNPLQHCTPDASPFSLVGKMLENLAPRKSLCVCYLSPLHGVRLRIDGRVSLGSPRGHGLDFVGVKHLESRCVAPALQLRYRS